MKGKLVLAGVLIMVLVAVLLMGCAGPDPFMSPIEPPSPGGQPDPSTATLGGFTVIYLVLTITAFVKEQAGLQGKQVVNLALGLGFGLFLLSQVLDANLIPVAATNWILIIVKSIGYALSVPGLFDLGVEMISRAKA